MSAHNNCCECSDVKTEELKHGLPPAVEESIKTIIAKEGYVKYNIVHKEITTNGGNYFGVLHEVDISGLTADGDKETNIFVKCVPPETNQLKLLSLYDVYAKELQAYNGISRIFAKIQDDANVPLEERYTFVKYYDESNTKAILLDNLTKKGFMTNHRLDVLPYKFFLLAVQELAKFHAVSFVLKEKYPEYYEKKIKPMKQGFIQGEDWFEYSKNMVNRTIKYLDYSDKTKVEKQIRARVDRYFEYVDNPATKYCLCHGDYRPNNIMIKETKGEASKVIPIDYQLMNCGNPVHDFFYLIYVSTDRQFRKDHLEELKNFYFESLTKFLQYFDLDVENIFPRKVFETRYVESRDYAVAIAVLVLPFILASDDDVPDVTGSLSFDFQLDACFKDRFQGIIEEFIELGCL